MLKKTKTRELVISQLEKTNTPLSASDIFNILKSQNITLSSVYRTLDTFTKENIIIKDSNPDGISIYTLNKENHRHYLECKNCHTKIELDYCPYHVSNEKIYKKFKFEPDENNIIIYGICKDCKNKRP